jgi:hypothetical protein
MSKIKKKPINQYASPEEKTETFIYNARLLHGDTYDYSKVKYVKGTENVTIICKIHGEFEQTPHTHTMPRGCQICGHLNKVSKLTKTNDDFIIEANMRHSNEYDYSKVIYKNGTIPVIIICTQHGKFNQRPDSHLNGAGCPECAKTKMGKKIVTDIDSFVDVANEIHENKYDYSKSIYVNTYTKMKIICPEHGVFLQAPQYHIYGN